MAYVVEVLGGLALFLFGVNMLSHGMEKLAGDHIHEWMDRMTGRPLKGAVFGAGATALMQSSSLLMVTMIGLINANLMTLNQAVGVMMGQEIGTTLTAQIAAFSIGDLCYVLIVLGFVGVEFGSHDWRRDAGQVVLGIGILFLGMNLMSGALRTLTELPAVADWLAMMCRNRFAGIVAGAVLTAVVQSSSAVTALVVAMGISHAIELPGAISILLGANIGTCVTGLLASLRLSRAARRASVAQIMINVVGVLAFLPFLSPFTELVTLTSSHLPRQIANAHTIFNVAVSVALFPFVRQIVRAVEWLVPEPVRPARTAVTAYIDERQFSIPQVALQEAARELERLGDETVKMLETSRHSLLTGDLEAAIWVVDREQEFVDAVCQSLEDFVNNLLQRDLSARQQRRCFKIKNLITDLERIGDLTQNLAEAAQQRIQHDIGFSEDGVAQLEDLFDHATRTYALALEALRSRDETLAQQACTLEDEFDELYLVARQGHIDRLDDGACEPEADVIFMEVIRNLERISDHAENIAISVMRP